MGVKKATKEFSQRGKSFELIYCLFRPACPALGLLIVRDRGRQAGGNDGDGFEEDSEDRDEG